MKNMFRTSVALIIILTMLLSVFPVVNAASNKERVLFLDNFEQYAIGGTPIINGSASHSVQKSSTEWSVGIGENIRTIAEEGINNKIAEFYNDSEATKTVYLDKSIGYSEEESIDFEVSYRIKPYSNNSTLYFEVRGDLGEGATSAKFNVISMYDNMIYSVTPTGTHSLGALNNKKWTNIKLCCYASKNKIEIYVDGIKKISKQMLLNNPVSLARIVVRFNSKILPGSNVYYDDIKFCEIIEANTNSGNVDFSALDKYRGVHPRVLLDSEGFEHSKKLAQGELKDIYDALVTDVDTAIKEGAPDYHRVSDGGETWIRDVADDLMKISYVYRISGDEKYKDAAVKFFYKLCEYPAWGRDNYENSSLAASHALVGIACYYDWLYHDLSATDRYNALNILVERGSIMSQGGKSWKRKPLSNLHYTGAGSIPVVAAAIFDEYKDAENWFRFANEYFGRTFRYISVDGANQEGAGYWSYAMESFVYYLNIAKNFLNMDFSDVPYIQKTSRFGMDLRLPRLGDAETGAILGVFNFSDSATTSSLEYVPTMAFFADYTDDKIVQDFVHYIMENCTAGHRYEMWKNLLYYDETLEAESYVENYPTSNYYDDLGFVFSRTAWDDNRSAFALRCGPAMGHNAMKVYTEDNRDTTWNLGLSHVHPDVNSFLLFAYGDRQIVDDGYVVSYTSTQNTLTVNGIGQYNGYDAKAAKTNDIIKATLADPKIIHYEETDDYTYVVCDGTEAYLEHSGLEKFVRHLLYMKNDDMLYVVDDIKSANKDDLLELRYFTYVQNVVTNRDGSYTFNNDNSVLNVKPFVADGAYATAGGQATYDTTERHGTEVATKDKMCVYLSNKSNEWIQPVAFSWAPKGQETPFISEESNDGKCRVFNTGKKRITIDIENNSVKIDDYSNATVVKADEVIKEVYDTKYEDLDMMDAQKFAELLNLAVKTENNGQKVQLTDGKNVVEFTAGSNTAIINGETDNMERAAVLKDGSLMLSIQSVLKYFNAYTEIDNENSVINIFTNVLLSESGLYSLSVNGVKPTLIEGTENEYEAYIYGSALEIYAIPNENLAVVDIEKSEDLFGTSKVKVTSVDGTSSQELVIHTKSIRGFGNMDVYNITYSGSDGNYGEYIYDGEMGTRWSSQGYTEWITFDFGSVKQFDKLNIAFQSGTARKGYFDIQVSNEDKSSRFKTVKSCESSGTTDGFEEFDMEGATGRYVRLYCKGNSVSSWNSIAEVYFTEKGGVN